MSFDEWENLSQSEFDAVMAIIAERDALNNHLGNLLAVIHRDGGHYQGEHGTDKAVADAMLIVSNLIADLYTEKSLRHSRESALESLTQTYVDVVEQRSKLEAEVARLKAALGEIDGRCTAYGNDSGKLQLFTAGRIHEIGNIARKSLGEQP